MINKFILFTTLLFFAYVLILKYDVSIRDHKEFVEEHAKLEERSAFNSQDLQNVERGFKEWEVDTGLRDIVLEKFAYNSAMKEKIDEISDPSYLWIFSEDESYYTAEQRAINPNIPNLSTMVATYRINKRNSNIEILERVSGDWFEVQQ